MSIPIINLPYRNIQSCVVGVMNQTTVLVTMGRARDFTDTYDINSTTSLTCSTTFVGVNGLDSGTVQPNSLYAVYLIYDPTLNNIVATLLALAGTVPVMPSINGITYSARRRVGWVLTDGSSNFVGFRQLGDSVDRFSFYQEPQVVLTGGAATSFTSIPLAPFVPPLGRPVILNTYYTAGAAGESLFLRITGTTSPYLYKDISQAAGVQKSSTFIIPSALNTSRVICVDYSVSSGSVNIEVAGFYDFLA